MKAVTQWFPILWRIVSQGDCVFAGRILASRPATSIIIKCMPLSPVSLPNPKAPFHFLLVVRRLSLFFPQFLCSIHATILFQCFTPFASPLFTCPFSFHWPSRSTSHSLISTGFHIELCNKFEQEASFSTHLTRYNSKSNILRCHKHRLLSCMNGLIWEQLAAQL